MEAFGAFSGIIVLFLIIAAILAFLLPFFVFRIRNEMISMNKKMSVLIQALSDNKHSSGNKHLRDDKRVANSKSAKCYLCNKSFPLEELSERGGSMFCESCIENINPNLFS